MMSRSQNRPMGWLVALPVIAFAMAGCGGGGGDDGNSPPAIESVTATPFEVVPGGTVTLRVNASDPEGDPLTYSWFVEAGKGYFPSGYTAAEVTWIAPDDFDGPVELAVVTRDPGHQVTRELSIDVSENAPVLVVTPEALNFGEGTIDTLPGGTPPVPTVTLPIGIRNLGRGAMNWTAVADPSASDWVNLAPASGVTTSEHDTVEVTVNRAVLSSGYWGGQIIVGTTSGDTARVPLAVWVPPTAAVVVMPHSLDLGSGTGPRSLIVKNAGMGTMNWQAAAAPADSAWLDVSPGSGTLGAGASDTLQVTRPATGSWTPGATVGVLWVTSTTGGMASVAVTAVLP